LRQPQLCKSSLGEALGLESRGIRRRPPVVPIAQFGRRRRSRPQWSRRLPPPRESSGGVRASAASASRPPNAAAGLPWLRFAGRSAVGGLLRDRDEALACRPGQRSRRAHTLSARTDHGSLRGALQQGRPSRHCLSDVRLERVAVSQNGALAPIDRT
jgi:hypothetical protein